MVTHGVTKSIKHSKIQFWTSIMEKLENQPYIKKENREKHHSRSSAIAIFTKP